MHKIYIFSLIFFMFTFYSLTENSVCSISGLWVTQNLNKNVLIFQDNPVFEIKDAKDALVVLRRGKIRLHLCVTYTFIKH